jgi:hypothetical protein
LWRAHTYLSSTVMWSVGIVLFVCQMHIHERTSPSLTTMRSYNTHMLDWNYDHEYCGPRSQAFNRLQWG